MNAGQAIGLLAGLGALNALRGGRDGAGPRFTGLLDMIDGGGAGRSGDRFEGGGLLSALGNLFAKPYEAQDRVERIATDARSANGGMTLRPRARPEMVSRNNVEPIDAYGVVPALPSRNNAEPVGPYGLMSVPAVPETYVNPYSVGGGFRETAPLPMNYKYHSTGDIIDRAQRLSETGVDIETDPRVRAEFKLNSMFQGGGPVYPDDPEMTNQDYLALLPPVPPKPVSGMPTPMPTQSRFGPDGPQTAEDFAIIHAEIQRDLGIQPSQLYDIISNDPDQYERLVSIYSRYGGSAMSGIHSTPAQRVVSNQPESQSLRDTFRSAYSETPFSASSLF